MKRNRIFPMIAAAGAALLFTACTTPVQGPQTIDWLAAELPHVDSVLGAPRTIETPLGAAVRFDGTQDAFFLDSNPLLGMEELTIEVIFRQESDAAFEQRFLHFGTANGERIMFETRVKPDGTWYADNFIRRLEPQADLTLIDSTICQPADRWYNLTLVVADGRATNYVDGVQQLTGEIPYRAATEGIASIGVRQNKVCWFKGDIYRIRVTPRALTPDEFLRDQEALNAE